MNNLRAMYVQPLTLNQTISKVQTLIDSGNGDVGRLCHIMEFLKSNKPLYRSDQAYLEKKTGILLFCD